MNKEEESLFRILLKMYLSNKSNNAKMIILEKLEVSDTNYRTLCLSTKYCSYPAVSYHINGNQKVFGLLTAGLIAKKSVRINNKKTYVYHITKLGRNVLKIIREVSEDENKH